MKHKSIHILLVMVIILGSLLSACRPAAGPGAALADPTRPSATTPPEVEETSAEQAFLDQHGFIVIAAEDGRSPVLALSPDGQALAPILAEGADPSPANLQGAVWLDENDQEQDTIVSLGEDGMPEIMQIGDYTVLFSEYTETSVSLTLYQGDVMISSVGDVPLDDGLISRYRELQAESARRPSAHAAALRLAPPGSLSEVSRMFEMVGVIVNLTGCAAGWAFPPTMWFVVRACTATLVMAVTALTGEDFGLWQDIPLAIVDAFSCFSKGEAFSCAALTIGAINIVIDLFENNQKANGEIYNEALEDPGGECRGSNCKLIRLENDTGVGDTITLVGPATYTLPFGYGEATHSLIYGDYQFTYTSCEGKWTSSGTLEADSFWDIAGPPNCND